METIPAVITIFGWFLKEMLSTARLQQLGMEAEYVVTKMKKIYKESSEESGEGLNQFENMLINGQRHITRCKYWGTTGCFRKGKGQYLHMDHPTVSNDLKKSK